MSAPTRFTRGVTTVPGETPLGMYPLPDPFQTAGSLGFGVTTYYNDFGSLASTDYTLTGTGTPTFALGSYNGGTAVLTTTIGASDSAIAVKSGTSFAFVAGQKAWSVFRGALSDATTCAVVIGLVNGSSITDGVYFSKASGSTTVTLITNTGSSPVTAVASVGASANATYFSAGWYYDGKDLLVYANEVLVARVANAALTTAMLTPIFSITNGSGVVRTLSMDYFLCANEVVR